MVAVLRWLKAGVAYPTLYSTEAAIKSSESSFSVSVSTNSETRFFYFADLARVFFSEILTGFWVTGLIDFARTFLTTPYLIVCLI